MKDNNYENLKMKNKKKIEDEHYYGRLKRGHILWQIEDKEYYSEN